jgi:hypothetical protein
MSEGVLVFRNGNVNKKILKKEEKNKKKHILPHPTKSPPGWGCAAPGTHRLGQQIGPPK